MYVINIPALILCVICAALFIGIICGALHLYDKSLNRSNDYKELLKDLNER